MPSLSAFDPLASGLFQSWRDPVSGIESHVLVHRVAPLQQSFYFTQDGWSADGRYLWFYAAFPPGGSANYGRMLAVADLVSSVVRYFPETQFSDASPALNQRDGKIYWATGVEIWRRGPCSEDRAERVNALPPDLARDRRPYRLATPITFAPDGGSILIDAQIGNEWITGDLPLDGSPFRPWQRFDRCYNHGQFNPIVRNRVLLAQDWWHDAASGERFDYEDRLWVLDVGSPARPVCPESPSRARTHEWWSHDGEWIWYVDYGRGTERVQVSTGLCENIWPAGTCHSHCDRDGRWLVGDIGTDRWKESGCRVAFFNRSTGREVNIATRLPTPELAPAVYHVHPHPRFCVNDH